MKQFIAITLFFFSLSLTAQNVSYKQWDVEIAHAKRVFYTKSYPNYTLKSTFYSISCNYRYSAFLETGLYYSLRTNNANLIFQQKIHLMPLLFKEGLTKINVYIPIGFSTILLNEGFSDTGKLMIQTDGVRFGIGASYNCMKKIGIFSEYYIHKSNFRFYKPYVQIGIKYNWAIKQKTLNKQ